MNINYWLLKSEPDAWSWDNQVKEGASMWDGVRNYQARNNLKEMKKNDLCFFYHSVTERSIVGIVKVVKEYYPDPTDKTGRFVVVDVKPFVVVVPPANAVVVVCAEICLTFMLIHIHIKIDTIQ